MKYLVSAAALFFILTTQSALARQHHQLQHLQRHPPASKEDKAQKKIVVIEKEAERKKPELPQVDLDARGGKTLAQVFSELDADVEWENRVLAKRVVKGSYHGSREAIIKELIGDLSFVTYYDQSRLRVIIVQLNLDTAGQPNIPQVQPPPQIIKRIND